MAGRTRKSSGFTLIELIMVMIIIAIIAGVVAPSFHMFSIGRKNNEAATQILDLAQYAKARAIAEGCTYRLNFDPSARAYWITFQNAGGYQSPPNDFGTRYTAPDGVRLSVNVTPQFNTQLNIPPTVQQNQTPVLGNPLTDEPNLQPNQLMQNAHDAQTTYVEFQPSGRTDPAKISLTDSLGHTVQIVCASETESFRILKPGETP